MYSQKLIAAKAAAIESQFPIKLKEYSISEVDDWVQHFKKLVHPEATANKPKLTRALHEDERNFIANEVMMCKISYPYWAPRYAFIKFDKGGVGRLVFKESQEMLLDALAKIEESGLPAKIINLKARQVYASTFSETVLTHKTMNMSGITSVVASDEPDKSEFLFNMLERIYDNLPFYLKPKRKYRVKGSQLYFDELDSLIDVESGNKRVGGIGQGLTLHSGHISELATWTNTDQITADIIPAVLSGQGPNTFFIIEFTANGKFGFSYEAWKAAKAKEFYGFFPIFIPWWIMTEKYASPPADGWGPSDRVLKLAVQLKNSKGVNLTRKQMYWWDETYNSYRAQDKLNDFYAEYASDDEEAFQLRGKTVFNTERLNDMMREAKVRLTRAGVYQMLEKTSTRENAPA